MKPPKPRPCKGCLKAFTPTRPLQVACCLGCALAVAREQNEKRGKVEKLREQKEASKRSKEAKAKLKPRRKWLAEAQVAFNKFIRTRDKDKLCICCGLPLASEAVGGLFDCGHYRSIGSAPHMRFDERNAHGQRKQCNRWGSGRAVDYRLGLIARIGIEEVEALEADQSVKKWTVDDLKAIKSKYMAKVKQLA